MDLLLNEVQVWRVALHSPAAEVEALGRLLSADERDRAERFRLPLPRDRFIVGRAVLRILLGRYLNTPPDWLQFQYGARGKPALVPVKGETVQFNVAHSADQALIACARDRAVGVDIEKIRSLPDATQLAARFFTPQEHRALSALPVAEQEAAFFRYWTCKEAYLKAIGSGLAQALDRVEIDFTAASARLKAIDSAASAAWTLQELAAAPGYAAAIVVQGGVLTCRQLTWQG